MTGLAGWGLVAGFFGVALVYAAAGLGGGSTYLALLTLGDVPWTVIPIVALVCNVVVVSQGAAQHIRAGTVPWRRMLPLVLASVPAAMVGAMIPLERATFTLLVGGVLLLAGAGLMVPLAWWQRERSRETSVVQEAAVGGFIGLLAGLTGIGGGIYLAPFLHWSRWAEPRSIAATTTVFILLNSLSGLAGRAATAPDLGALPQWVWLLPVVVLVGGLIGSRLSVAHLDAGRLRQATGLVVALAGVRLLLLAA